MTDQPNSSKIKVWQIIAGVIIVLVLLSLAIPSVRASISSFLGISVAPSAEATIAPVTLEAIASETPTQVAIVIEATPSVGSSASNPTQSIPLSMVQSTASSGTPLDLSQLSNQVGWSVLTPGYLPQGYQYQSAYFDTNNKMLVLTYLVTRPLPGSTDPTLTSSETVTLLEAKTNNFIPMQIAPNTNVEDVQVNGSPAAFTIGGWDTQFVKDNSVPGGGKMVSSWRNDLPVKNLYWQVGDVYYLLVTTDNEVSQQDLNDIASSMGQ
jgi:hypothetical protein